MPRPLVALLLCACGGAPVAPARPVVEPFAFHDGFWLNLHLRLFGESGPRGARELSDPAWQEALDIYRTAFPERRLMTLLTSDTLVDVERRLADTDDEATPTGADAAVLEAIALAAPIYREKRWPADHQRNQEWIAAARARLAQHGRALTDALGEVYRNPWPGTMRVEVAVYGGPVGAYTVIDPTLIVVSSRDERNAGDQGLEILLHEASHALVRPLSQEIAAACERAGKTTPPTLWHAFLFYTTGEVVRRRLGAAYVPYAEKNGLYARAPGWDVFEKLLRTEWQPFLDGKTSFADGVARVCAGLTAPPRG